MIAHFMYGLHPISQALLILSANVLLGLCFVIFCRAYINTQKAEDVELKIGIYTHAFGISVSVFLSLIIVTEWDAYTHLAQSLRSEISNLNDLYHLSEFFNQHITETIQRNLRHYVEQVMQDECRTLYNGAYDTAAEVYLFDNFKVLHQEKMLVMNDEHLHRMLENILSNIINDRRVRIFNSESALSPIMWGVIIACDMITLFILALAAQGPLKISVILQSMFALGIGLMLLLIVILNKPFYYGTYYDGSISSQSFRDLLGHWERGSSLKK